MSDYPMTAAGARKRADAHRDRAMARRHEVLRQIQVRQEFTASRHHPMTREPASEILDRQLGLDKVWTNNVKDNQWWLAQATAYGATEAVDLLKQIVQQNTQVIQLLKEIRDDRRATSADGREANEHVEPGT